MLDDAFTYGGWACSLVAVGVWLWLARRAFPSFDAFVKGFDDELQLGASCEERALASGPPGGRGADRRSGPVPVDRLRDSGLIIGRGPSVGALPRHPAKGLALWDPRITLLPCRPARRSPLRW